MKNLILSKCTQCPFYKKGDGAVDAYLDNQLLINILQGCSKGNFYISPKDADLGIPENCPL